MIFRTIDYVIFKYKCVCVCVCMYACMCGCLQISEAVTQLFFLGFWILLLVFVVFVVENFSINWHAQKLKHKAV
jgi:hypothetical protein